LIVPIALPGTDLVFEFEDVDTDPRAIRGEGLLTEIFAAETSIRAEEFTVELGVTDVVVELFESLLCRHAKAVAIRNLSRITDKHPAIPRIISLNVAVQREITRTIADLWKPPRQWPALVVTIECCRLWTISALWRGPQQRAFGERRFAERLHALIASFSRVTSFLADGIGTGEELHVAERAAHGDSTLRRHALGLADGVRPSTRHFTGIDEFGGFDAALEELNVLYRIAGSWIDLTDISGSILIGIPLFRIEDARTVVARFNHTIPIPIKKWTPGDIADVGVHAAFADLAIVESTDVLIITIELNADAGGVALAGVLFRAGAPIHTHGAAENRGDAPFARHAGNPRADVSIIPAFQIRAGRTHASLTGILKSTGVPV